MDKATAVEHVKRYAAVLALELPVRMVVLFGSHVSGTARPDSDIDVAVVMDEFPGDFLTLSARLCALRTPIDPAIEPHLLSPRHDASGFVAEVMRTGEVIYAA
jgi:predicted nucleotidyltransferase